MRKASLDGLRSAAVVDHASDATSEPVRMGGKMTDVTNPGLDSARGWVGEGPAAAADDLTKLDLDHVIETGGEKLPVSPGHHRQREREEIGRIGVRKQLRVRRIEESVDSFGVRETCRAKNQAGRHRLTPNAQAAGAPAASGIANPA